MLATGCYADFQHTTTVRVVSPTEVSVVSGGRDVLPSGKAEGVVSEGSFSTGQGGRSNYRIVARRSGDGAISLVFDTPVPMSNGEEHLLVPASGAITLAGVRGRDIVPEAPRPAFASVPMCASLEREYLFQTSDAEYDAYAALVDRSCSGVVNVPIALSTTWSNVREVRQDSVPERGGAIAAAVLGTLLLAVPGAILLANASGQSASGWQAVFWGLGGTLVGLSVGLDLMAAPTIFAGPKTTILYPP